MDNQQQIEALELAIEILQGKLAELKGDDGLIAQGGPGKDPLPPDPTHPQP